MFRSRFVALQHRDFRLFWIGYVISVSGQQMLWMLEPWLIYEMTGSKLYLGASALVQAVPATGLVLLGGVIADRFDQRKLLFAVQVSYVVLLGIMAALALMRVLVIGEVLVLEFLKSAVGSFESPARQSMFPHLVDREAMPNAIGLNSSIHPATRIGAPVIGGYILNYVFNTTGSALTAAGIVLLVTIAGIMVYAITLLWLRLPPIQRGHTSMVRSMQEGARFIWRERIFAFLIGLAWYNMFFGISFTVLLPVIQIDILKVDESALGWMWGLMGVGSVAGVIISTHFSKPGHQRWSLIVNPIYLGIAMVGLALSPFFLLSLFILFIVGTGQSAVNVAIQQNLQMLVPNQLRGRVMGVWSIVHTSIRPLGETQFSGVAALAGAPVALIVGGAMLMVTNGLFTTTSKHGHQLADLRQAALERSREEHP